MSRKLLYGIGIFVVFFAGFAAWHFEGRVSSRRDESLPLREPAVQAIKAAEELLIARNRAETDKSQAAQETVKQAEIRYQEAQQGMRKQFAKTPTPGPLGNEHWGELQESSQPNITFSEKRCGAHPPDMPPTTATMNWEDAVLVVRAPVCMNCSLRVGDVTARADGDSLWLDVKRYDPNPNVRAQCDCERALEIRIRSLPKREYTIKGIAPVDLCI